MIEYQHGKEHGKRVETAYKGAVTVTANIADKLRETQDPKVLLMMLKVVNLDAPETFGPAPVGDADEDRQIKEWYKNEEGQFIQGEHN